MERGYINIKNEFGSMPSVEVKLVDGTLWLTKYQIADLFDVFTNTIDNNIRAIFKSKIMVHPENGVMGVICCILNRYKDNRIPNLLIISYGLLQEC